MPINHRTLHERGRCALLLLLDVAMNQSSGSVKTADASRRQGVSRSYAEQLFPQLKNRGLIETIRGPGGGHRLAIPAEDISLADVVEAVQQLTARAPKDPMGLSGIVGAAIDDADDRFLAVLRSVRLSSMVACAKASPPPMTRVSRAARARQRTKTSRLVAPNSVFDLAQHPIEQRRPGVERGVTPKVA